MARETRAQSQVTSDFKKMVLDTTLFNSIIRYVLRVKWINPGEGVDPPQHLNVVATEKGVFRSPSTTNANFIYLFNKSECKKKKHP